MFKLQPLFHAYILVTCTVYVCAYNAYHERKITHHNQIYCTYEGHVCSVCIRTSARKWLATACRACRGQAVNQSMEVLFTSPGKFLQRVLSTSPMGDMQRTTCRLLALFLTKYDHTLSLVGCLPAFIASSRTYTGTHVYTYMSSTNNECFYAYM